MEVTSEAPLVDTTSTQLGAVINDRAIVQLPLNRATLTSSSRCSLACSRKSASDLYYGSGDAGSVSVNGGRGRSNNFSVNGGDANDLFANLPTVQPSPDSVEEFRILTNTFDAEYGRNSGSVVNVVTKSGTNQFHGNVYEFFRNKVLNSSGYFDTSKPAFSMNQFGGTFGGPIKKDRTFFFVSYEGRRVQPGNIRRHGGCSDALPRELAISPPDTFAGGISDNFVADVLNTRAPGCTAGEAGRRYDPHDRESVPWSSFPGNVIPTLVRIQLRPICCALSRGEHRRWFLPGSADWQRSAGSGHVPFRPSHQRQAKVQRLLLFHRSNLFCPL